MVDRVERVFVARVDSAVVDGDGARRCLGALTGAVEATVHGGPLVGDQIDMARRAVSAWAAQGGSLSVVLLALTAALDVLAEPADVDTVSGGGQEAAVDCRVADVLVPVLTEAYAAGCLEVSDVSGGRGGPLRARRLVDQRAGAKLVALAAGAPTPLSVVLAAARGGGGAPAGFVATAGERAGVSVFSVPSGDPPHMAIVGSGAASPAAALDPWLIELARQHDVVLLAAGVCPGEHGVGDLYARAAPLLAHVIATAESHPVVHLGELRHLEVVAATPGAVRRASVGLLDPILRLAPQRRRRALATLRILFEQTLVQARVVEITGWGRSTVDRYFTLIQDLTGKSLKHPPDVIDLAMAYRTLVLYGWYDGDANDAAGGMTRSASAPRAN